MDEEDKTVFRSAVEELMCYPAPSRSQEAVFRSNIMSLILRINFRPDAAETQNSKLEGLMKRDTNPAPQFNTTVLSFARGTSVNDMPVQCEYGGWSGFDPLSSKTGDRNSHEAFSTFDQIRLAIPKGVIKTVPHRSY